MNSTIGVNLDLSDTATGRSPNNPAPDFLPPFQGSTKSSKKDGAHTNIKDKNKSIPKDIFLGETETIKEWWIGHVLEVFPEERYFSAHLRDLKFVESVAEYDFDSAFKENEPDLDKYLFKGAEFAFFVTVQHGPGSPKTISWIEFSSPYIWKEEDNKKAESLYLSLFGKDDI
jgi:hypothetical protein